MACLSLDLISSSANHKPAIAGRLMVLWSSFQAVQQIRRRRRKKGGEGTVGGVVELRDKYTVRRETMALSYK